MPMYACCKAVFISVTAMFFSQFYSLRFHDGIINVDYYTFYGCSGKEAARCPTHRAPKSRLRNGYKP